VTIEQRELLVAMHDIAGIVDGSVWNFVFDRA
jgi:hypothetical protein